LFETRLFEEKDLPDVVHINWACLPENYTNSFFLDVHKQFPQTFLVTTIDDKTVGYIMCRVEMDFSGLKKFKLAKKGHVISLAVLPDHRMQGIAHDLLSKVMKNISAYGVSECYLEVRVSNVTAITLYQDLGFKILRTIPGYYQNGESAHVMVATI